MPDRTPPLAEDDLPLISQRTMIRLVAIIVLLVALTAAISFGGHWLGEKMALGGHTKSEELYSVTIGEDTLSIPANMIRFADQRSAGEAERLDLYMTWPGLKGYGDEARANFDNVERSDLLLFLQISQSTMSKDMSGRLGPIYTQLFDGPPQPFDHGLTLRHLRSDSGYGEEVILTANRASGAQPYTVRCLIPTPPAIATSADCQRDIHVGKDLTVLYRFSSALLRDWDHIDAAVQSFVQSRLAATQGGTTGAKQ